MIYQRNSAKLGVLTLIPVIKGMKIKQGNVLMYRKKRSRRPIGGQYVTEAYELKELPFKIPKDVLEEFGYDEKIDIFKTIENSLEDKDKIIFIGGTDAPKEEESSEEKLRKVISEIISKM